jgi:hypothetical protein
LDCRRQLVRDRPVQRPDDRGCVGRVHQVRLVFDDPPGYGRVVRHDREAGRQGLDEHIPECLVAVEVQEAVAAAV